MDMLEGMNMGKSGHNILPRKRLASRGFTLVEMLIVLMIMAITTSIALDYVSESDASLRADRAAREAAAALLYARSMSVSYGGNFGVEFDTANNRFQVFKTTGSSVVTQSMSGTGTYVINLSRPELAGTTMTPTITGDTTNPYDVIFGPLGTTTNNGTVAFTYNGKTKTVTIPKLGDPTIN